MRRKCGGCSIPITSQSCRALHRQSRPWEGDLSSAWITPETVRMRYLIVIEKGSSSFGAYVPDLPGCIAVGESREEVLACIQEAIEIHMEGLRGGGQPIPPPSSSGEVVE